ncbi:Heterokaryon incompatibility protein 6, OR allele [Colletotrichum orbiculare MAFF 240422]|uniref:Heterokaryon incompatibility protein 6, OR allele n=1 Tax=Colletotrichum orbiculare (strain 104-T / ATCC 96160 / CBS 514.97 / LARS 414 / MAFF 240422) TaxID=1213857 RepID=N4VPH8_COLOR|nr:Heterokaryon incompatibility protein 6, OR allele [Colletotrichum orbiculare MAFF 240422]
MPQHVYTYQPLPAGRWFRQLHIHPGQLNDPIVCDLVNVAIDNAPPYTALSYVWGNSTQTTSITCSGVQREVTVSLFEGLRRIRSRDKVEIAWADAICINQSDNIEKAGQVNLMGAVYDKAAEVVVWLGEDTDAIAGTAFHGVTSANAAVRTGTQTRWNTVPGFNMTVGEGPNSYPVSVLKSTMPSILEDQHLDAIEKLYQLPWFTRVWVLQEVGLATRATAFWGDKSIDFSELVTFIHFGMSDEDLIKRLGQGVRDVISGPPYYAFWNVWSTYDKKGGWVDTDPVLKAFATVLAADCNIDFVLVLEASRRFNATNPLDHVFAFLGHPKALMPQTNDTVVQADYGMSLPELHLLVASNLAQQSLNFLVQVQNSTESLEPNCPHPTWVPQWHINDKSAPSAFWEAWDASLRISRQFSPAARLSGTELTVRGIVYDTVDLHTDTMKEKDFDRFHYGPGALIEQCWNLTETAAQSAPHVYGDDKAPLAFASTLTCDYRSSRSGPETGQALVEDFMQYADITNEDFYRKKLKRFGVTYRLIPMQQRFLGTKFHNYGSNRRFFTTRGGYWGLGPPLMRGGDVCAVLMGGDVPFVLRPTDDGRFRLVGQAYMYGVMYGELVTKAEIGEGTLSIQEVRLV